MTHLILLTALALIALVLFLVLRRVGIGLIQTISCGAIAIGLVWGALHLAYVSDALYVAGLVELPASVAWQSVPFAWLWHDIAVHGWIVGIVIYVPTWFAAALARALRRRLDDSSKPLPLHGAA